MQPVMDVAGLTDFLARDFPQVADEISVISVTADGVRVHMTIADRHLRPGGTVSGATIFSLADVAVYLAVLSRIGPVALAVTTSASIDYMRKPAAGADLLADVRLLKLGRQLAVADALVYSEGQGEPAARASMTFAIPPAR